MRSDLRHTVFSAARFSDILRRSYRAKPAISCFIAFAAQPGVSFPRHALYYNTRPMDKCQAIFRFILQSLFSFFSGNANFFCREPFVVILSKIPHFIPVHLRHIAVCIRPPVWERPSAPSTLPQARRSSPCRMPAVLSRHLPEQRRIVRPKSPAKNFFGGAIKRPRPALYKRTATQAPLKIAEKQLDGGQRHDEENNG